MAGLEVSLEAARYRRNPPR